MGDKNTHIFTILACLGLVWLFAGVAAAVEPLKIGAIFALSGKAKNSNHRKCSGSIWR